MTPTRPSPRSPFRVSRFAFRVSPPAFTIIELLVVIAIIVLLMAILLPALGSAKRSARIAETKSLLTSLSTDIEAYFTTFDAYPGPATPAQTTTPSATDPTGTQNLLLGLTYSLNSASAAPAVQILGGHADPTKPTGPTDFRSVDPSGNARVYSAFYSPTAKELSPAQNPNATIPTWAPGGVTAAPVATAPAFPTILDRFPDALPILYYRKTPGVDGTGTFTTATGNISAQGAGTSAATAAIVGTTFAAMPSSSYFLADNAAYTGSGTAITVSSISGTVYPQNLSANDLATEICSPNNTGAATSIATSHGGYVLLSAGPDRLYGGGNKSDDIIVVGGQ